jgi:hypothetical protein
MKTGCPNGATASNRNDPGAASPESSVPRKRSSPARPDNRNSAVSVFKPVHCVVA